MYPLQKSEEKCFQIISFNPDQHIIPEDLVFVEANNNNNNDVKNLGTGKRRKLLQINNFDNDFDNGTQDHKIKLMHRERERQRRQEMGDLYKSLRTLLPLEFIKGKRAISDQMNGAVNYIKHQKKKIKEMEEKRDELKKLHSSNELVEKSREQNSICSFKMSSFHGGLEILITTNGFYGFPLSRILKVVVQQGLEIISCASTTINDQRSIHTIRIEVSDSTPLDLSQLGRELTEAVPQLRQITD